MPEESEIRQPLKFCRNDSLFTELVRTRAYELYLERGMEDGHDVEDWICAEEEVLSENKKSMAVAA
jgi:hypothetical protein